MRALVVSKIGDPTLPVGGKDSPLHVDENFAKPPALKSKHSVRIRVVSASLNYADALMVMGKYQERPDMPYIAGSEVSGVVSEVGEDVHNIRVGDSVAAVTMTGGYAEEVIADEAAVFQVPQGCEMAAAAGLPVAFGTAHVGLVHRAQLAPGQVLLVLGAAGGVGAAAVQIGKLQGATVIAAARGSEKAAFLHDLGADSVIDTATVELTSGLRAALSSTKKKGVDVLFDPVGGQQFKDASRFLQWGGHLVIVGFASGEIPSIPANILLVKNLTAHGLYWGSYLKRNPKVLRQSASVLMNWLRDGSLKVPISHQFHLSEAHLAYQALLSRKAMGKVILKMSEPGGSGSSKL